MKKYEGLFIINLNNVKEEGVKETIDKVSVEIEHAGGQVLTVQKMDKRPFARVANRRVGSGFYVNIILELDPKRLQHLRERLAMQEDLFRVLFTESHSAIQPAAA